MLSLLSSPSLYNPPHQLSKPPFPITRRVRHLMASATNAGPQRRRAAEATMYELLSVAETARAEEIKAAYKKQARRWHPDVCPPMGDKGFFAQQFMQAREAYEVLSDPVLRHGYDLTLMAGAKSTEFVVGDWETQLEGLGRRRERASTRVTWGSRMRHAHG